MKHRVQFEEVVAHLRQRQQELVAQLRTGSDQDAIETKRQIEAAIECLLLCEQYQIYPDSTITVLGWSHDRFGNRSFLLNVGNGGLEPCRLVPLSDWSASYWLDKPVPEMAGRTCLITPEFETHGLALTSTTPNQLLQHNISW